MATLVSHIHGVGDVSFILVKHEHVIVTTSAMPMLQSKAYAMHAVHTYTIPYQN